MAAAAMRRLFVGPKVRGNIEKNSGAAARADPVHKKRRRGARDGVILDAP